MLQNIDNWKRSVYCGDVTEGDIGNELTLMGWVQVRRDHGGLIFVDLRDRAGVVQIVFNPETDSKSHNLAHQIRTEYVLAVKGVVNQRPEGTQNLKLKTGLVEVAVSTLKILNSSEAPPFVIEDESDVHENVRLKYRYLDLRRPLIQKNLIFRHKVTRAIREYLSDNAFIEIETPMLTKSTPEGARDYLVPSRMNPGRFYALPQSPQLFKQILMVSGFDKYFQIVRCFRDEDLRADRQPEFTQVDMEMSFVEKADVMEMTENLIAHIFKETLDIELKLPFTRLTYHESVDRFGVDNPDTRFGLELKDITSLVKSSAFKVFADTAKGGGIIKTLNAKGCGGFSRSELDGLTEVARGCGAKGLAWVKIDEKGWKSPIAKFFKDSEKDTISEVAGAAPGDLLLFVADKPKVTNAVLGRMRLNLGERLELIPKDTHELLWITDFPLLEFDEDEERYIALHHPFTAPTEESLGKLFSAPLETTSDAYDLVLNGSEIGGGSIRIHRQDIQLKIFKALGIGDDEAKEKFGFLLDALQYGAPPHGGIALGLDRLVTILLGTPSIRDVIAFPKTQKATCLMTEAPSSVSKEQLDELSLRALKLR